MRLSSPRARASSSRDAGSRPPFLAIFAALPPTPYPRPSPAPLIFSASASCAPLPRFRSNDSVINPPFRGRYSRSFASSRVQPRRVNLSTFSSVPWPDTRGVSFLVGEFEAYSEGRGSAEMSRGSCITLEEGRGVRKRGRWVKNITTPGLNNTFNLLLSKRLGCIRCPAPSFSGRLYLSATFINSLSIFKRKDDTSSRHRRRAN